MDYKKLDERLEYFLEFDPEDEFININLEPEISNKLFDYQFLHIYNLIIALKNHNIILDGSDTGTGKTYTAIALAKQLDLVPFIICPKTIIPNWFRVCKYFGVKPLAISNYESIKMGYYYNQNNKRVICPYLKLENKNYIWDIPDNTLVIFDEAHRCKTNQSGNSQFLLSAKNLNHVILLSATISEIPENFSVFGYLMGFYNSTRKGPKWLKSILQEDNNFPNPDKLSCLNKLIYPEYGSRMRIKLLGNKFPKNQITADAYLIPEPDKLLVNQCWDFIKKNQTHLKSLVSENILAKFMACREKLELLKLNIFLELIPIYLENGYSVVIFLNFNKSVDLVLKKLKTNSVIRGGLNPEIIQENIKNFQENKTNIIICNTHMAEGISLHDLYGKPRVSLISPPLSSTALVQIFGRISRVESKTPALQRVIYCADTCEEVICNRLREKLKFLSKLNDNDLIDFN